MSDEMLLRVDAGKDTVKVEDYTSKVMRNFGWSIDCETSRIGFHFYLFFFFGGKQIGFH